MLKDITLGQFFPGSTVVHRLDPRTKLILLIVYLSAVLSAKGFASAGLVLLFLVAVTALGRIPFRSMTRGLKPMLIIMAIS